MKKNSLFITSLVLFFSLTFFLSCSNDDEAEEDETEEMVVISDDTEEDNTEEEEEEDNMSEDTDENADLLERFIFEGNIVIENSYNTGGCDSPPCDTNDESLVGVFENDIPDDPYFYLSEDESELFLECQFEEGRRIEFKQRSEGSLTSFSKIQLEGVYYDIPSTGITIAQVHNRGGSSNKPFFRLVLYSDGLETVIRKDPEVSSSETSFSKEDFAFVNNEDYDLFNLNTTLEKSDGFVHITVEQDGVLILEESFQPDSSTRWVTDTGIANGFYLKAGIYNDDGPYTKNIVAGFTTVKFESDDQ